LNRRKLPEQAALLLNRQRRWELMLRRQQQWLALPQAPPVQVQRQAQELPMLRGRWTDRQVFRESPPLLAGILLPWVRPWLARPEASCLAISPCIAIEPRFSVLKIGAEDGALRHKDLFYHPVADNYFKL
jgi:hypothetical protein